MCDYCKYIPNLRNQHKLLITEALETLHLSMEKEFPEKIFKQLSKFSDEFESHINYEEKHFYNFLSNLYKKDDKAEKFRIEMTKIATIIFSFLHKYNNTIEIMRSYDEFVSDFEKIVKVLMLRIEKEENSSYFKKCIPHSSITN